MDTNTGRFISQDSYAGSAYDPVSLHKYLYANSNPVTYSDPSGYFSLGSVVCASTIGNMLFYSASSGMIALGMNLLRQLRNVQNGMQEYVKWSDAIADAIIAMLLGEFFFCAGTLAASLSSAAIYLALGGSSLIFFMMNCAAAQNDLNTGNYDLATLEFIFAAISVYSAKSCFDNAAAIVSAKATAGSTTNPSTDNKQTATEASGNNGPSDNVKTNTSNLKDVNIDKFTIKNKHLNSSGGNWNKFNVATEQEAMSIVKNAIENGEVVSTIDNGLGSQGQQSYKTIIETGQVIGTNGETQVVIVYDELGNVWTVFPK